MDTRYHARRNKRAREHGRERERAWWSSSRGAHTASCFSIGCIMTCTDHTVDHKGGIARSAGPGWDKPSSSGIKPSLQTGTNPLSPGSTQSAAQPNRNATVQRPRHPGQHAETSRGGQVARAVSAQTAPVSGARAALVGFHGSCKCWVGCQHFTRTH